MKKKMQRMLAILLTAAMAASMTSVGAFAAPDGGVASATPETVGNAATIYLDAGKRVPEKEYAPGVVSVVGEGTDTEFSGTIEIGTYFASGIVAENGSTYTIKDSTITAKTNPQDNDAIEPGGSIEAGTAVAVRDGSFVTIENTTIDTEGAWGNMDYVRGCVAVGWQSVSTGDKVVIRDSTLTNYGDTENTSNVGMFPGMPGVPINIMKFLTVSGQGRAFIALGDSTSYLYNDYVQSNGWAAICNDMASEDGLTIYALGTTGKTTAGGYGAYSDTNCADYFYGSTLQGADFGVILSVSGVLEMDTAANASQEALAYATADDIAKAADKPSVLSGGRNAIMTHSTDIQSEEQKGTINLKNTAIITSEEFKGDTEEKDYLAGYGAYFADTDGAAILVKSSSENISIENCTLDSYTNVLIEAVVDCDGGGIAAGETALSTDVTLKNVTSENPITILNLDYQRPLNVTMTDMNYNGVISYATKADFEELAAEWNAETVVVDYDKDVEFNGGINLTLGDGAVWTVADTSIVSSLKLEGNAQIIGNVEELADGSFLVTPLEENAADLSITGPDTVKVGESIELSLEIADKEPDAEEPPMDEPPEGDAPDGDPIPNTVTFTGTDDTYVVSGETETTAGSHEVTFSVAPAEGYTVVSVSTENNVDFQDNGDGTYTIGFTMTGDTDAVVTVVTAPVDNQPSNDGDASATPPDDEGSDAPVGEPPANALTVNSDGIVSVKYADGKDASDCPRTGVIVTVQPGYTVIASGGTVEAQEDGTFLVTPDPGPDAVTISAVTATATTLAADFAGYLEYLNSCAEEKWSGDSFLQTAKSDIANLTESNYSSAMIYTILVNDLGYQSYTDWLAAGGGQEAEPPVADQQPAEPPVADQQPAEPPVDDQQPAEPPVADQQPSEPPADATEPEPVTYTWTSSDPAIATVTGNDTTATVIGVSTGIVTITVTGSNGATASKDITVTADQPAPTPITFPDVKDSDWFADAVQAAAQAGIINGFDDGTFRPDENLTRAQAATIIALAAGLSIDKDAVSSLSDANGDWYTPYIAAAQAAGIINGYEDGTFKPAQSVTRAELVTMIAQAKGLTIDKGAKSTFQDSNDDWYTPYIAAAQTAGMISGYPDGTFKPNDQIKRSEAAQMIYATYLQ